MKKYLLIVAVSVAAGLSSLASAAWYDELPFFDPVYYADQYQDIYDEYGYDADDLKAHWRDAGISEGRRGSPVFDPKYYLEKNPDVAKAVGRKNYNDAMRHWRDDGLAEGRVSHPDFNVRYYIKHNKSVQASVGKHNYEAAVQQYLDEGYKEGLKAAP